MKCGPYFVLVIIVYNRVMLFIDGIHKRVPGGISPKYLRLLYGFCLTVSLSPIFHMGDILQECKVDLFSIGKL